MSRARSITYNGEEHWYDTHANGKPARVEQIELLATVENLDIDDVLDEGLTQGEIIERLRKSLGQGEIPPDILRKHKERRRLASIPVRCRAHPYSECEGPITRHHFVPNWLMKELENYEVYAQRVASFEGFGCTIPLCIGYHRDLHMRMSGHDDKSIVGFLTREERLFAHKMLTELEEQHPKIIGLIRSGWPEVSYEAQLIRDYDQGKFIHEQWGDKATVNSVEADVDLQRGTTIRSSTDSIELTESAIK